MKNNTSKHLYVVSILVLVVTMLGCTAHNQSSPAPAKPLIPTSEPPRPHKINILLDDFKPQPYQGESVYYFNRLEGDRGAINYSNMDWGDGQVTTTISQGNSWGGVWMSLNHPIREGLSINFSVLLPAQILPAYQSYITGITVHIISGTPGRTFKLELKNGNELSWKEEIILEGGEQVLSFDLPALENINQFVWVLDHAVPGDFVIVNEVSFTATTQVTDTATTAFVWSYGMLLNNWDSTTGLVRDKAKDASGEFDAIQATGSLAAATAIAEQLGVVGHTDATQIVNKISEVFLQLPRYHGLWPHWVKVSPAGKFEIIENTEWSSVDTVIAAIGLLEAQSGLGMDASGTEQMLQEIEWANLITGNGISHGYTYSGEMIPYAWDAFGGESWLVEFAYAGVTGQVAPLAYPSPPTANGSGFIDELAWLFVPPPSEPDYWGTDWTSYRSEAVDHQISYYSAQNSTSCFSMLGLFGLSAGEVPSPSMVAKNNIYQAYGIGGAFVRANDGSAFGDFVVAPHYSAMIASLRPEEAIGMWHWLIASGYFSPLNNVESLMFPADANCDSTNIVWNQLKGSWNLSLQTLGWGRYLAERNKQIPILWEAITTNSLLKKGYQLLAPSKPTLIAAYIPQPGETATTPIWDYTQVSCDGKPLNMWGSPGTYLYQRDGSGAPLTVTLKPGEAGRSFGISAPPGVNTTSGTGTGTENITTALGTFQATTAGGGGAYSILTGRLDYVKGTYQKNEWYVCGYGLIKHISSDSGIKTPGDYSYSSRAEVVLVSFTPLTTNESHVRYILADIQLGNVADDYRANITDEETAEALRRWDAGVQVGNLEQFERKILHGQRQIVYAGTENPAHGIDINLTSDPSNTPISSSTPTLTPTLTPTPGRWSYERECEYPDDMTLGEMIERSNASGLKVHGQFGTIPAWPAQPGYVQYSNINIPQTDTLYLKLRYSKYSPSFTPIQIYMDDELTPRVTFTPMDQGDWNIFIWTEPIPLGSVEAGIHSIKFYTDGQQYGVADLDMFVLTAEPPVE